MTRSRSSSLAPPIRLAALAMVAVATLVGSALDPKPLRPHEMREGFRVLEADFHAHTRFSDGFLSPPDLVDQAARRGLDVIAVSEHNQVFPAKIARAYSRLVRGPTVVVAEEITTHDVHLLALGIEHRIDARQSLADAIRDVHRQGGVVAAAHPTHRFSQPLYSVIDDLDATEVMHPIAYQGQKSGIGAWSEMRDFYEKAQNEGHVLAPLGDSDYHFGSVLGITRTFVFAESDSEADVIEAIRRKRTVTFDLQGHGYGDPLLVSSLEKDPLTARQSDYGYRGEGVLDVVFRTLGFLGVVAWLFLGARSAAVRG